MITQNIDDLIGQNYQVVYADPPWKYYGDPNKPQAAGKHYPMMSDEELGKLPVREILAKKGVLFCWTTSSKMASACKLITDDWKLYYRGVFQVWVKTTIDNKVIHGQGTRPSFTKPTAEYLLVASTQEKGRAFPISSEKMQNVVMTHRPNNVHSRKPAIFRDNIVTLLGDDKKRVELFSREEISGWDAWGNELKEKKVVDE